MSFCTGCGHQIHETALACTQCGAVQHAGVLLQQQHRHHHNDNNNTASGTLWLPVPALVCGVVSALSLLNPDPWTQDEVAGVCLFATVAIVLGSVGLARQKRGHGLSIAAVVLGALGLLGALGALAS